MYKEPTTSGAEAPVRGVRTRPETGSSLLSVKQEHRKELYMAPTYKQPELSYHTVTNSNAIPPHVRSYRSPSRLAKVGDVYEFTRIIRTLGGNSYEIGERCTIIERTPDSPYGFLSSLGNLRVEIRNRASVWSSFDNMIATGFVAFVSEHKP